MLRNRLGIEDGGTLAAVEFDLVALRSRQLVRSPTLVRPTWDVRYWCGVHRYLFGDLYDWAGELRTVDISKDGHGFHPVAFLSAAVDFCSVGMQRVASARPATSHEVIVELSSVLADMNQAHPFREGNGRTQRFVIGQLALVHGLFLDWSAVTPQQNLLASKRSASDPTSFVPLLELAVTVDPTPGRDRGDEP